MRSKASCQLPRGRWFESAKSKLGCVAPVQLGGRPKTRVCRAKIWKDRDFRPKINVSFCPVCTAMFVVRHLMSLILHFCCLAKSNTPACQSTPTTVCCYFSNFPIRAEPSSTTKLNLKLFCCDVTWKKGRQ